MIKLLDFGIAKVMQTHTVQALEVTDGTQSVFTPAYGAPEQFTRKLGASVDLTLTFVGSSEEATQAARAAAKRAHLVIAVGGARLAVAGYNL